MLVSLSITEPVGENRNKKAVESDPAWNGQRFEALTTPDGAGVWLDGFLIGVPIPT